MSPTVDLVVARRWLERRRSAPANGEPEGLERDRADAAFAVGNRLNEQGRRSEALDWLRAGALAGHAEAAVSYAAAHVDFLGNVDEAERWLRRAADAGSELGMLHLGRLLVFDGRLEEGDEWLARAFAAAPELADQFVLDLLDRGAEEFAAGTMRRLADAGNARAAALLSQLELRQGREAEVERWLLRAHELHDDEATFLLARRAGERGDAAERRRWLELGAARGHAPALLALGHELYEDGDHEGARRHFERAAEAGGVEPVVSLLALAGVEGDTERALPLLEQLAEHRDLEHLRGFAEAFQSGGHTDVAEHAYDLAARRGDAVASVELGRLLLRRGDAESAARRLRGPAAADVPDAGLLLGIAESQRGDRRAARASFERAARAGDGRAAHKRGLMAFEDGDAAGTLEWYGRGARLGDTSSMYNLGTLHALLEPGVARAWLEEAARRGHPHAGLRITEEFG